MVVPGRVEPLPLRPQHRRIELGVEDPFLVVERPGQVRAARSEDRAASPADDVEPLELVAQREVSGYDEARWKCDGAITNARDSRAMWTSVACQASESSAVEAM